MEPNAPVDLREKFILQIKNSQILSGGAKTAQELANLVSMFNEYLFLNDCRALGIIP